MCCGSRLPRAARLAPSLLLGFAGCLAAHTFAGTGVPAPLDLAGTWRFQLDRADVGLTEQWSQRSLPDRIQLPGALQSQGYGDDLSTNTAWTGSLNDRSWYTADRYAPYRQTGNVKLPFWLQPEKHYVGAAWYQRDFTLPQSWSDRRVLLELERPHWGTRVWLDDRPLGEQDALGVPHRYDLGTGVTPGPHRLTIRVDNRQLIAVGPDAHSISDQTQGNWNGLAGTLQLRSTSPVWIEQAQVYPDAASRTAQVRVQLANATGQPGSGRLRVTTRVENAASKVKPLTLDVPVQWDARGGSVEFTLELGSEAPLWDEFNPALHRLRLEVPGVTDPYSTRFGLRDVKVEGHQIRVNDRRIFLRGTLECCIFPLTGYPPADVPSWKRILRVARAHGLNHLRFHSWCPPEAAFVAADELGFYYQVEASAWAGSFNEGKSLDTWIYAETERMLQVLGNHPSFLMMVASNEAGGPNYEPFLDRWVGHWKSRDPRRLYSAGSGWPHVPENQFHVSAGARAFPVRAQLGQTREDYRTYLAQQNVPIVSHEIGQYCVFPNLDEIPKYRGPLKARNFEIVRDFLTQAGLLPQARPFLLASGRLQTLFYKDEIEAALRTPGWAGFQLLDLHDFPGQGTALVGVLDPFWDSKGYVLPREYRRFCHDTVPLARLAKRIWTSDETFEAAIELAHFGARDLNAVAPLWRVREVRGPTLARGRLDAHSAPTGQLTAFGEIRLPLQRFRHAAALNLEVRLPGTPFANDWNFWVYPQHPNPSVPANVTLAREWNDETERHLTAGGRVILLPDPRRVKGRTVGRFDPIFWNKLWFPTQPQHTLGLLLDPRHPALAGFPTAFHADWQWQDLQNRSRPLLLEALPQTLQPFVQVIDDWNTCRKLALAFEARVGSGRLLVVSIDLEHDLPHRPAARQFRESLLAYAAGPRFAPRASLTGPQIASLFRDLTPTENLGTRVLRASSAAGGHDPSLVLDADPGSMWHTPWGDQAPPFPHHLILAFDQPARLRGLKLLPRQDNNRNGWIKECEVYASDDGERWDQPIAQATFTPDAQEKEIRFAHPTRARFLKLVALSSFNPNQPYASLAELTVVPAD